MDSIGFSLDAIIGARPRSAGVLRVLEVEEIVAIYSVDMVRVASSGGRALNMVEPDHRADMCLEPWPRARPTNGGNRKGALVV